MSHLTLSSCVLALGLVVRAAASQAASLTDQSGLTVLVGRGRGGGQGFSRGRGGSDSHASGCDGGFARSGGRVMDDVYRGGRYWGGTVGGAGYGYDYCGGHPPRDSPPGTFDQLS